jgi:acetyl esterase
MPLDPEIRAFLQRQAAAADPAAPPLARQPAESLRRQFNANLLTFDSAAEPVASVAERAITGGGGAPIQVRIYTPPGSAPFPALVYFHGGGWVVGNLDTHDSCCRSLANGARCVVLSVDYRLAPENRFPAAAEDACAALCYASAAANDLGIDARLIAVGGDSAGGNLATVACLMARDRGGPRPVYQLLVYPVTNHDYTTASYREDRQGYFLTEEKMRFFWSSYLGDESDGSHPYASPLRAPSLAGLPAALVITAGYDPLRDEGEAYALRLRDAGVAVRISRYETTIQAFFVMGAITRRAHEARAEAAAALRNAFATARLEASATA